MVAVFSLTLYGTTWNSREFLGKRIGNSDNFTIEVSVNKGILVDNKCKNEVKDIVSSETAESVVAEESIITEKQTATNTNLTTKEVTSEVVEQQQKYSYCPIGIDLGGSVRTFYCENKDSGVISDHIYTSCNGSKNIVLSPGSDWDCVHVCDPSVIEGNFSYEGTQYRYLMAYLGCNTTDCQNNQIGLAVSNSLELGWVRVYNAPFIGFNYDDNHSDCFQWGVGQPSLVSVDNGGTVAIFYTQGTWNLTSELVEVWDLSNLDNPVNLGKATVSNSGTGDFISNADYCYDINSGTLYMVSDVHPFSSGVLGNIADSSRVCSTSVNLADVNSMANCSWSVIKVIDSSDTGHDKNHNAGFIRDSFGHVSGTPSVLCTTADELSDNISSLWTYNYQRVEL